MWDLKPIPAFWADRRCFWRWWRHHKSTVFSTFVMTCVRYREEVNLVHVSVFVCRRKKRKMKKKKRWSARWKLPPTPTPPSCSSKEKVTLPSGTLQLWFILFWMQHSLSCFCPDFPANNIVKFLLGFTNKGSENFVVESLDASFRYPQVQKHTFLF